MYDQDERSRDVRNAGAHALKTSSTLTSSAAPKNEDSPTDRVLVQTAYSIELLEDTINSMEAALFNVIRPHVPDAQSTTGDVREAGQSPIHQTLLDQQVRIQRATQAIGNLRNRLTV